MADFIPYPRDPLVLRGFSLDQQTQIGFCGTPLQVLHQQGYTAEEEPLRLVVLSSPLREQTKIRDGLDRDCRRTPCSVCRADSSQDEGSNEDMTTEGRALQGGDR